MPSLLIVDDEANIRASLEGALGREGYQVATAGSLAEARERLEQAFDFVLLDVWLPDGSGLDLLAEIMAGSAPTTVVMMSGHGTIETAVRATRLGAFDFVEKPLSLEHLIQTLRNASAARSFTSGRREPDEPWALPIVGRSPAIRSVLDLIRRVGPSMARVLIAGEHGTGKELVARALWASGPRREMPFVAVNCAALPEELLESELFGHERGAFTGATQPRRGRFEEANGGTLFLDEVGDLSPRAQTKLLRALQEGAITRVGSSHAIRVDVRVIAATNRDLADLARSGRFREDLYYRLAVIPITVPPLRERPEDIPLLVRNFAERFAREGGGKPRAFTPEALDRIQRHPFPGNVRELSNLIERLLLTAPPGPIGVESLREVLPAPERPAAPAARLSEAVQEFERREIEAALHEARGNMTQAAARLGLERSHLYKKMKKLGLRPESWGG
jgi:two-component system, NtrC family, nitrogen regulation response regulator NtrX